jgi:hypothetical protein
MLDSGPPIDLRLNETRGEKMKKTLSNALSTTGRVKMSHESRECGEMCQNFKMCDFLALDGVGSPP